VHATLAQISSILAQFLGQFPQNFAQFFHFSVQFFRGLTIVTEMTDLLIANASLHYIAWPKI